MASAKGIETIQGNTFDTIAKPESFSLLYLNPPYDSEICTIANRCMEAVRFRFVSRPHRYSRSRQDRQFCQELPACRTAYVTFPTGFPVCNG